MEKRFSHSKFPPKPLSRELRKIASNELQETDLKRNEYLIILREWIETLSILDSYTIIINDNFLLTFLRGSKFDLKRTKKKIISYFQMQETLPEIFNRKRHCDDPQLIEIIKTG